MNNLSINQSINHQRQHFNTFYSINCTYSSLSGKNIQVYNNRKLPTSPLKRYERTTRMAKGKRRAPGKHKTTNTCDSSPSSVFSSCYFFLCVCRGRNFRPEKTCGSRRCPTPKVGMKAARERARGRAHCHGRALFVEHNPQLLM